jgi:hypothetical protein
MTDIGSPGRMKADMIWMKYLTEMLNPVVAVTSIGLVRMAKRRHVWHSQNPRMTLRKALIAVKTRMHHHGVRPTPVEYYRPIVDDTTRPLKSPLTLQPIPTAREPTKRRPYHHCGTSRYFFMTVVLESEREWTWYTITITIIMRVVNVVSRLKKVKSTERYKRIQVGTHMHINWPTFPYIPPVPQPNMHDGRAHAQVVA